MMSTQTQTQQKTDQHAGVIQSSIALLQERFKQLQKVKEMRERRDLLRMFSNYDNNNTTHSTNPTTCTNINVNNNNNNASPRPPSDTAMQYGYYEGDDELQVFLPPNYYNYVNHLKSAASFSSSSLSHHHNKVNNSPNSNEISLSLWPPISCNNAADHHRSTSIIEAQVSKSTINGSSCVSSVCKVEDSNVSDVDTTLHL